MQISQSQISPTEIKLSITPSSDFMSKLHNKVLKNFQKSMTLPGFRKGKAPLNLVEKNADTVQLQQTFLDEALMELYSQAIQKKSLRPVVSPDVSIVKFVPFTTLEFEAKIQIVNFAKLCDYKKIKIEKKKAVVKEKDIEDVLAKLQTRLADKKEITTPAKEGNEVIIDFSGVDEKKVALQGGDGKDYPLILGSDTFIPGFEKNLIGMKSGEEKTFDLVFPKDYTVKALANRKVTFTVKINKVNKIITHDFDDHFASHAGPFKNMQELRDDIKKQLLIERQQELDRAYDNEMINQIASKSKIDIPQTLIDEQIQRQLEDLKRNLTYRGQTFKEFLESEKTDEEKYRTTVLQPRAIDNLKSGLILSKIAELEDIKTTPQELSERLNLLKAQYSANPQMITELEKPEIAKEISMRIVVEKTLQKLSELNSK